MMYTVHSPQIFEFFKIKTHHSKQKFYNKRTEKKSSADLK